MTDEVSKATNKAAGSVTRSNLKSLSLGFRSDFLSSKEVNREAT